MSRSLTIADDAYASLKERKKDGESFSDVVRKLSKCGSGKKVNKNQKVI